MRYDVHILGGSPAGCVLAARLSEDESVASGWPIGSVRRSRWHASAVQSISRTTIGSTRRSRAGVENLYVADSSVMPSIPRANT